MASALRNFFLTFVIALTLFGLLAFRYYGFLRSLLPTSGREELFSEEVGETPEGSEYNPIIISPPDHSGDSLGALNGLIVMRGNDGKALNAKFLRFNSARRIILSCDLSLEEKVYNSVGVQVPLREYLELYPIEDATKAIAALTGFTADFYLDLSKASVYTMVEQMVNPTYTPKTEIRYVNPKYQGQTHFEDGELPSDYYLSVNGTVILNKQTLDLIFAHYETCDGRDGHESQDGLLLGLYRNLLMLLTKYESESMKNDPEHFAAVYSGANTNFTKEFLEQNAALLYKYRYAGDTPEYEQITVRYTTRLETLEEIKKQDQQIKS